MGRLWHPIMEYNGLSPSKEDEMVDSLPRRHCVSHCHFDRANFCGEGMGHFRSSDLEVNLKRTQNYFVELLALYLHRIIITVD